MNILRVFVAAVARRLGVAFAVFLLGLMGYCAQARAGMTVAVGPSGGTVTGAAINSVNGSDFTRLVNMASNAGDVEISDFQRLLSKPFKPTTEPVKYSRVIPFGAAAKGLARALPYVGTAAAVYEIFKDVRCRTSSTGIQCDVLQPEKQGQRTVYWTASNATRMGSADQACNAHAAGFTPYDNDFGHYDQGVGSVKNGGTQCEVKQHYTYTRGSSEGQSVDFISGTQILSEIAENWKYCDPIIDPHNPAFSVLDPVAVDGKCPSNNWSEEVPDTAAKRVEDRNSGPSRLKMPDAVIEALGHGVDFTPYAQPGTLTGPSVVVDDPVVTQTQPAPTPENPNPAPQTKTQTSTHNITYTQNTYNYQTTVVTVNPDGTTETTTTPGGGSSTSTGPTDCEKFPDSLGCIKAGEKPEDEKPQKEDKTIDFTPVELATAGCPAPLTTSFSVLGWSHSVTLEFTPICSGLDMVRGVALFLGACIAGWIFVGGLKS